MCTLWLSKIDVFSGMWYPPLNKTVFSHNQYLIIRYYCFVYTVYRTVIIIIIIIIIIILFAYLAESTYISTLQWFQKADIQLGTFLKENFTFPTFIALWWYHKSRIKLIWLWQQGNFFTFRKINKGFLPVQLWNWENSCPCKVGMHLGTEVRKSVSGKRHCCKIAEFLLKILQCLYQKVSEYKTLFHFTCIKV